MISVVIYGYFITLSLIAAIGAQSAFVIKQGLKREYLIPIILVCSLSDLILISLGVYGFNSIATKLPLFNTIMKWGGIIFILGFALKSLISVFTLKEGLTIDKKKSGSLTKALLTALAFTWLNPQVYIDTLVLIGSVSLKFVDYKKSFIYGATLASVSYFLVIGYTAKLLSPYFKKAITWRILNTMIAIVMFVIAYKLYKL